MLSIMTSLCVSFVRMCSKPLFEDYCYLNEDKKEKAELDRNYCSITCAISLSFIGNASFQVSLKRREFLKPDLSRNFRSHCSSSTPLSRFLFGDELSKSVKDITRANKIMAKVMPKKRKTSSDDRQNQTSFFAGPLDRITPRSLQLQLQQESLLPREAESLQEGRGEQSVKVSYAGYLSNFVENWRQITSDPTVCLKVIISYSIVNLVNLCCLDKRIFLKASVKLLTRRF